MNADNAVPAKYTGTVAIAKTVHGHQGGSVAPLSGTDNGLLASQSISSFVNWVQDTYETFVNSGNEQETQTFVNNIGDSICKIKQMFI